MSVMPHPPRNPHAPMAPGAAAARTVRPVVGAGAAKAAREASDSVSVCVTWSFDAALVEGAVAQHTGHSTQHTLPSGSDAPQAELRCEVRGGFASAALHVPGVGGASAQVRMLAERVPATVTIDRATGYEHMDAPGVLSLTRAGARLLCARTPLLAQVGVAGGRAERPRIGGDER